MTGQPQLEVLAPGAHAALQDAGRHGLRRVGVPWAGALDPRLMRLANALAGQPPQAAVIEAVDGGLRLAARHGPVRLAVAGDAVLDLQTADGRRAVPAWCALTLQDGEVLTLRSLRRGRLAAVAVQGLAPAPVLGSASTYARAGLGGVQGRALRAGDVLPVAAAGPGPNLHLPQPPAWNDGPIRAVPGPQADHFDAAALAAFTTTAWRLTADADRMGVRLDGPALQHAGAREIVSDATVPGSVQVPGNGLPIVLLADAQTAGGYPKIATVVSADLPRVAQLRPGATLHFQFVDVAAAEALARAAEAETRALLASLRPWWPGGLDIEALYTGNLVSGMLHALAPASHPDLD